MEPSSIVGRRPELERLAALTDGAEPGVRVGALTGAAGMGKTTLWRHAVDRARDAGHVVLTTQPAETEAHLSYAGLSDLLRDVDDQHLERLPVPQRLALEVALLRREPEGIAGGTRAVGGGLLSVVRDLAARQPVLVAVDDAQWLDAATAVALAYALRRLDDDSRANALVAIRVEDTRPRTFVDAVAPDRRVDVPLGPLNVASIHAILKAQLGWAPTRPTLVRLVAACGGNPFYALETARELDRLGRPTRADELPVPEDVRTLVRERLARLPQKTRTALLEAACLAAPTTDVVSDEALGPAEEAGVIDVTPEGRIAFAHPLFAAGVRDTASRADRRRVHRRLAEAVTETEARARHFALAASGADAEAASKLDAAAQLASARGAPEAAAELAELALRLTADEDAEALSARALRAARLQFDAGDFERAQSLLEQVLAGAPPGARRARVLQQLGQLHGRRSSFESALELALAARAEADDDPGFVAELELDVAYDSASLGDFGAALEHAQKAVVEAEQSGSSALLAVALGASTMSAFLCGLGLSRAQLDRALELEAPLVGGPLTVRPSYVSGILLLWSGDVLEALATFERLRLEALEQGTESELPLLYVYMVWGCLWAGDPPQAAAYAEEATHVASLLDDPLSRALALSARALAHAHAGDEAARAESLQAKVLFEELRYRPGAIWPPWASGLLELALDDPAAAHAALATLADVFSAAPGDPVLSVFVPDEIEACVALGEVARAERLLEAFEARAQQVDRGWALAMAARSRALVRAAAGDLDGALTAAQEALDRHGTLSLPFDRARTLLMLGRLRRRRKEKRLARAALEEALTVFEALPAAAWAEKARAELARVVGRRAPSGLTATEQRIAALAAQGLKNKAIAEQTFVTVSAVEANLGRVYRKLGISSRAQLARALDDAAAGPAS